MKQLELELWQGEPWEGRSPRVLTKGFIPLFLRRKPQKDERFFVDPCQMDLFHAAKTGPPPSVGAPLLIPLDRRVDE